MDKDHLSPIPGSPEGGGPGILSATPLQWRTLFAAGLGWALDAMDVMLYAFALLTIRAEFGLSGAKAGALASATLLASAAGGILFGALADRYGRARALTWSILAYSVATALTATSATIWQLVLWRAAVGIGLGGEWSAGSVLVSETWPSSTRGRAIGLMQSGWAIGYTLAALLSGFVIPRWGWRPLFAIGILPAVLAFWIRRSVPEPRIWAERASRLPADGTLRPVTLGQVLRLKNTILATLTTAAVLFGYWGLFTWVPAFLAAPSSQGGAGMTLVKSTAWIIPMQAGAFLGYILFGFLADRIGRRPAFISFLVAAAAIVPLYGHLGRNATALMVIGPLVGFFGHGYFSVFGAMLSELFPTEVRATAQGLAYNSGRALSALAPWAIGALADAHGIGSALAGTSAFFVAGAVLMTTLPETRGWDLGGTRRSSGA